MMRVLFRWFDTHPESYWAIAAVPTLLWVYYALAPLRTREIGPAKATRGDLTFILLSLATLVAWRWPFWLNAEPYNPDESQFIAGALTLTRDPLFWRTLDGTTSGPLNFYALLPLHWLGLPLDYFTARATGILLVWVALIGCYRLSHSWYGRAPARLAIIPLTLFFAAAIDPDFVHYSSEHASLALIGIAAWAILGSPPPTERPFSFLLGGMIAGALPWAKLQSAPIAAALVGLGLWRVLVDSSDPLAKRTLFGAKLVVGALLPTALAVLVAGASGQLENLYHDYLVQNFSYIDQNWSLGDAVRQMWRFSFVTGNLVAFGGVALTAIGLTAVFARSVPKQMFIAAGVLTSAAILCVILPKRASLHYALLLVIPLGIWLAVSVGELWQLKKRSARWRITAAGIAMGAMLAILYVRWGHGVPEMFGRFADHWRQPRSAAGAIVHTLTDSKDRLAVWGWTDRIYVESGLPQATHESESFEQIAPSRQREHYRARYVRDLERTRPAVFVDATGTGAYYFTDRTTAGHESVPALAAFVRENYRLLVDLGSSRIFVTPERLRQRPISRSNLWEMIAASRRDPDTAKPTSLSPRQLPRKKLPGRSVQMMLPPAEMTWELDGTEREIFLEYGFDPAAYQKVHGNGAEIIVELNAPDSPKLVLFSRLLDPYRRPDDRGHLVSRIVLPPFPSGSKLTVHTTPGEFGDNAWDWIYLGRVDWVRAPFFAPTQFPGFSRPPDRIASERISIIESPEGKILMTHAPTSMSFTLTGVERCLQFDYGFQPGAYLGPERTDGATFILELSRVSGESEILFSRKLDPANQEGDQGRQHTDGKLPDVQEGDQLTLRIDSGGSSAWDWTYITNLQIEEHPGELKP